MSVERIITNGSQLHDNWDYAPDDEVARLISDRLESQGPPEREEDSKLCSRCRNLELSSATCSFSDSYNGLRRNCGACELCRLLSKSIPDRGKTLDEAVNFYRAGSNLLVAGDDRPAATLCTTPGERFKISQMNAVY